MIVALIIFQLDFYQLNQAVLLVEETRVPGENNRLIFELKTIDDE
jgi:hypothetical protein